MTNLKDPLIEARFKAQLIETRGRAIADYARKISETPNPDTVEPEGWQQHCSSLRKLLDEIKEEIDVFVLKASFGQ